MKSGKGKQENDAGGCTVEKWYKRTELEEIKNDMEHVKNILGIIASGGRVEELQPEKSLARWI